MSNDVDFTVARCPPIQRAEALRLLLYDLPAGDKVQHANRLAESVATQDDPFAGLFLASQRGQPLAACWAQVQPGRTGLLWQPQPAADTAVVAQQLLSLANDYFAEQSVSIAQTLLPAGSQAAPDNLAAAGYRHLTELEYLVCLLRPQQITPPRPQLEYEVYSDRNHQRFCRVLEQTYQQGLDCPELDGLRQIEDVLEGYRNTGEFHPSRWMLLRFQQQDIGSLILADHPRQDQWELVYLGLVPEARGRGFGYEAACFATRLALGARRNQMVLAVDARNSPARAVYERAGFMEWDRRQVYWRTFA